MMGFTGTNQVGARCARMVDAARQIGYNDGRTEHACMFVLGRCLHKHCIMHKKRRRNEE